MFGFGKLRMAAGIGLLLWAWIMCASAAEGQGASSDLPPAGRSLFDHLTGPGTGQTLVYPFPALVEQLERAAGCAPGRCTREVAIPLGRSLQRLAATGEFFRFPRRIVAFMGEGADVGASAKPLLRDRLFLAFNERANLIEVISYNEVAGRFEFQLVKDYRRGGAPRLRYASRAVCLSCHQNAGPIFSRPLWSETQANPEIARRLAAAGAAIPAGGVDSANAVDEATDHANRASFYQVVWQVGCGRAETIDARRCRGALFKAVLLHGLSGGQAYDGGRLEPIARALEGRLAQEWPEGLAVPDPDLPNREPTLNGDEAHRASAAAAHVPARFEALLPRAPLPVAPISEPAQMRTLVTGLRENLAQEDFVRLDGFLRRQPPARLRTIEMRCAHFEERSDRLEFQCGDAQGQARGRLRRDAAGRLRGDLDGLELEGQALGAATLEGLQLAPGRTQLRARRGLLGLRTSGGESLASLWLKRHADRTSSLGIELRDDFALIEQAIDQMVATPGSGDALSFAPFRRTAVMGRLFAQLGLDGAPRCCSDVSKLPPAQAEPAPGDVTDHPLHARCAACHATSESSPPNFLAGDAAEVEAKVAHCAPRIHQRLAMWKLAAGERAKTPMPPVQALGGDAAGWPSGAEFAAIERYVRQKLRGPQGRAAPLNASNGSAYESLPSCLPTPSGPLATATEPGNARVH